MEHSNSRHEPPLKRMRPSNVDRISNLPDAMITHILSLMQVTDAVRTQLLSKQWRYAWTSSPGLIFSGKGNYLEDEDVKVINNALMLHKGPIISLSLFNIGCLRDGSDTPVNVWVQCAVDKRIEVLDLDVNECPNSYMLPHSLFLCDTLKEFRLIASEFNPTSSVFWKSLKKLTLQFVKNLSNDKIHKIITSSPVLESLNLLVCSGFSQIIVSSNSSKLRNLVISYQEDNVNEVGKGAKLLVISVPSITSLEISGYMGRRYCKLEDVSSLEQASFRFCMSAIAENHEVRKTVCRRMMYWLLRNTSHVAKLSLGTWCTQVSNLVLLLFQ
ncbi:F-box/LRR-repeat protein At3g26922-like [Silene latifolia]|uniref:F-box/LRR-repeat protein At3g26922-like n=1 Tax=Silene latifolia TaxID=37657 RepID=UPI003D773E0E